MELDLFTGNINVLEVCISLKFTKGLFTLQYMLKVLVKTHRCLGSGTTVGTQVLCHSVLGHHFAGYSVAYFTMQTGHCTVLCHCALFSGFVCNFVCNWLWMGLENFVLYYRETIISDKIMYLVFILFSFYFFFSFVDFGPHIGNTSERIKTCVKCNFDVKLISKHYFIFSSIVTLCFGFEVISNIKFILYSIF